MKRNRGNILFLILLAVVLFAALAAAVTSSMRGGGKSASSESVDSVVANIMQIQANMQGSLQRFLMTSGYTLEQIDMTATGTMNGDADSCTTSACNLHDPAGGNVSVPFLPRSAWLGSTPCCAGYVLADGRLKPQYQIISVKGLGTDLPEIVAYYSLVKPEVCTAINVASGALSKGQTDNINFSLGTSGTDYYGFTGSFTNPMPTPTPNQLGTADSRIAGKTAFGKTSAGTCNLILVLLER